MHDLPEESLDRLQRVTRLLNTQRTLPAKLETVVELVKQTVPGCDSAGIILLIDGQPTTTAVTDRIAVEIDLVQYETGEGPCLSAIEEGKVIRIEVLEGDSRFIRFAPGALDFEIHSFLSIPLQTEEGVVGALNLYSRTANAFDDDDAEEAVRPMAQLAADAIGTSPLYAFSLDMVDGLVETLESRAMIERATGLIMAEEGRTAVEALARLRSLALASGESMRTVAVWVLEEHPTELPPRGEEQLPSPDGD